MFARHTVAIVLLALAVCMIATPAASESIDNKSLRSGNGTTRELWAEQTEHSPDAKHSESNHKNLVRRNAQTRPSSIGGLSIKGLEKHVSPAANFVISKPIGWKVNEDTSKGYLLVRVADPSGEYQAEIATGLKASGHKAPILLRDLLADRKRHGENLRFSNAMREADSNRIVFDFAYADPSRGKRHGRCWMGASEETFTISMCETPAGRFDAARPTLLTILANLRVLKNTFPASVKDVTLTERTLADGSAHFLLPADWAVQDLGTGHFIAADPSARRAFIVAQVDMLTPELQVNVPGALVLPYMIPHKAFERITTQTGLLSNIRFEEITPRQDVARLIGSVYTAGPVSVEEFTYTAVGKEGNRCKAYTFGISWGSRLNINWRFTHLTVSAQASEFEAWASTFARMASSYRIDDQFAMRYIAQGMARLRQMQADTARIVAKNASDIRNMMQAAYDERQRSQNYIDYIRTGYIRGETDWISSMEGGTVYHTDSWGTKNTYNGNYYEGAPYDNVHFEGQNPRYNEQMTQIDNRQLFDQVFGR